MHSCVWVRVGVRVQYILLLFDAYFFCIQRGFDVDAEVFGERIHDIILRFEKFDWLFFHRVFGRCRLYWFVGIVQHLHIPVLVIVTGRVQKLN